MRHVPEGQLRRLVDEPFAVADADVAHVRACRRCTMREHQITADARMASSVFGRPTGTPDVDVAWARFSSGEMTTEANPLPQIRALPSARRRFGAGTLSVRPVLAAASLVAVAALAAGITVATTRGPARAPRQAAVSAPAALRQLSDLVGLPSDGAQLDGFTTPSGTMRLPFGTLTWTSGGRAYRVGSIAAAEAQTGLTLRLPSTLPQGISSKAQIIVQPRATATIHFGSSTGAARAGRALTITAGPAIVVEYGGGLGALPELGILAAAVPHASASRHPDATGSGASAASAAQLEAYVVSRRGVPSGLVQEIRLLGNLRAMLPVPTPAGAKVNQVTVDGSPAVLVSAAGGAVSGILVEGHGGVVHAALGFVDRSDILDVARQLG